MLPVSEKLAQWCMAVDSSLHRVGKGCDKDNKAEVHLLLA